MSKSELRGGAHGEFMRNQTEPNVFLTQTREFCTCTILCVLLKEATQNGEAEHLAFLFNETSIHSN